MKEDSLDRVRIASPCNVDWEGMSGDERVRFCCQCNLRVYNIAELSRREAVSLISGTEGRICARIYRRADGTVMTRDCPFGLRALRRRSARFAGAALTALLSLCAAAFGQTPSQNKKSEKPAQPVKTEQITAQDEQGTIIGTVTDSHDAVVSGAQVTLINESTKQEKSTVSSAGGEFRFVDLAGGEYTIEIKGDGFKRFKLTTLKVKAATAVRIEVTLQVSGDEVSVGVIAGVELLSTDSPVIIDADMLRKLPIKN